MNKVIKKFMIGTLAALMLFGGLFASTPLQVGATQSRCIDLGPSNTVTYRVTQLTSFRFTSGNGLSAVAGTLTAGSHVTRPTGAAQHATAAGNLYRLVRRNNQNIWVRVAHLSTPNLC